MEVNNKQQLISDFIKTLPDVSAVYGYGSGVINQIGSGAKIGQIDLIVVVSDTEKFHIKNLEINPDYYTRSTKRFFLKHKLLHNFGADICYIPYIKYKENKFKIGIISRADLINDLTNWKNLYMAGRFQKPMVEFKSDKNIKNAIESNHKSALLISLILQNSSYCSLYDLYHTLLSLSYMGDIRTGLTINNIKLFNFENPHKIDNIIAGSYKELNKIYLNKNINNNYFNVICDQNMDFKFDENLNQKEINIMIIENLKNIMIHYSRKDLAEQLVFLPRNLNAYLSSELHSSIDSDIVSIKQLEIIKRELIKYVVKTNKKTTIRQTLKGFLTVGLSDSLNYLNEKAEKAKTK